MQNQRSGLAPLLKIGLYALLALGFAAQAEDKKVDPTGTWTWTRPGRNGGPEQKMTLKLKTEGDKLTGVATVPGKEEGQTVEAKVDDLKLKGDEISFSITRETRGGKFTIKYSGKVTANSIKGNTEVERNGDVTKRDWEAKRVTETK
jgi:hypothetical protein